MSYAAYAGVQQANEAPRDLEIRAIAHVTRQLTEANQPGSDLMARIRALNVNAKLWGLLIDDLSNPDNTLPDVLKARYISLGLFARRRSLRAMTAGGDLAVLIRLNLDVLDALSRQRERMAA